MNVGRSAGSFGRFAFLQKASLEQLTPHTRPHYFAQGATVTTREQLSDAAHFILSGCCELRRDSCDKEASIVEKLGPGAIIAAGDNANSENGWTSAVAIEDTVILSIEQSDLEKLREA